VLHSAGVLRSVSIHSGADCTLLDPQRARCALPTLARSATPSPGDCAIPSRAIGSARVIGGPGDEAAEVVARSRAPVQ
jgi:hypothetical protein